MKENLKWIAFTLGAISLVAAGMILSTELSRYFVADQVEKNCRVVEYTRINCGIAEERERNLRKK